MSRYLPHIRPLLGITHFFLDLLILSLSLVGIVIFYGIPWTENWLTFLLLSLMLHILVFGLQSYYIMSRYESFGIMIFRLALAWSTLIIVILAIGFLTKTSASYSRFVIFFWSLLTPLLMVLSLCWIRHIKERNDKDHAKNNHSLVIGTDTHAHQLFAKLTQSQQSESCIGLVTVDKPLINDNSVRILGNMEHIRQIVSGNRIRKIYIALSLKYSEKVEKIQFALLDLNVDVIWAPDCHNFNLINHSIQSFQ